MVFSKDPLTRDEQNKLHIGQGQVVLFHTFKLLQHVLVL